MKKLFLVIFIIFSCIMARSAIADYPIAYNYCHSTSSTTCAWAAGILHTLTINHPVASANITVYDNTVAGGTIIANIVEPSSLVGEGPQTAIFDAATTNGIYVNETASTEDFTVTYH